MSHVIKVAKKCDELFVLNKCHQRMEKSKNLTNEWSQKTRILFFTHGLFDASQMFEIALGVMWTAMLSIWN